MDSLPPWHDESGYPKFDKPKRDERDKRIEELTQLSNARLEELLNYEVEFLNYEVEFVKSIDRIEELEQAVGISKVRLERERTLRESRDQRIEELEAENKALRDEVEKQDKEIHFLKTGVE